MRELGRLSRRREMVLSYDQAITRLNKYLSLFLLSSVVFRWECCACPAGSCLRWSDQLRRATFRLCSNLAKCTGHPLGSV